MSLERELSRHTAALREFITAFKGADIHGSTHTDAVVKLDDILKVSEVPVGAEETITQLKYEHVRDLVKTLVATKRAEVKAILKDNGLDSLTELLADKNDVSSITDYALLRKIHTQLHTELSDA